MEKERYRECECIAPAIGPDNPYECASCGGLCPPEGDPMLPCWFCEDGVVADNAVWIHSVDHVGRAVEVPSHADCCSA